MFDLIDSIDMFDWLMPLKDMADTFDPTQWITTSEATALTGYAAAYFRQLIAQGRLHAQKRGRDWFLSRTEVLAYAAEYGTPRHSQVRSLAVRRSTKASTGSLRFHPLLPRSTTDPSAFGQCKIRLYCVLEGDVPLLQMAEEGSQACFFVCLAPIGRPRQGHTLAGAV